MEILNSARELMGALEDNVNARVMVTNRLKKIVSKITVIDEKEE